MVKVIPVCFVDVDNAAEIMRKSRLCCKRLEAGCPWEISAAPRSRIHICKEAMRSLVSTQKSFTHDARSYNTNELWAVLQINPMRISATVPAINM